MKEHYLTSDVVEALKKEGAKSKIINCDMYLFACRDKRCSRIKIKSLIRKVKDL